jgi:hypothetical protein
MLCAQPPDQLTEHDAKVAGERPEIGIGGHAADYRGQGNCTVALYN